MARKTARLRTIFLRIFAVLGILATLAAIGYFSFIRYKIGLVRFFDADELAYMSWTAHLLSGSMPFRDFLYFNFPGYLLFLLPAFLGAGQTALPYESARVLSFFVSIGAAASVTVLAWQFRRGWTALTAGLLFLFLPLPSHKVMEIRPDTLSFVFVLLGMALQLGWMDSMLARIPHYSQHPKKLFPRVFFSGVLYGLGIFVLSKALVPVAVASMIALVFVATVLPGPFFKRLSPLYKLVIVFSIGLLLFPGLCLVWAAVTGQLPHVLYLLTKFPMEANIIARMFYMPPEFFFYQSDLVYGVWGEHIGYIANHVLWILGIGLAVFRLLTPFAVTTRARFFRELFLPLSFAVQLFSYLYLVPVHHAQYLIPIAMLLVVFCADGIGFVWRIVSRSIPGSLGFVVIWVLLLFNLVKAFDTVYLPKLSWIDTEVVPEFSKIQSSIPTTEPILDLVGLTMFHPYPYYACCIPFGQFAPALSRPLPPLLPALERVNYIFQGRLGRTSTFSGAEAAYISEHFEPVGSGELLKRKTIPLVPGLE